MAPPTCESGHAPSNVADRHYVKPDQDSFDQAVEWLGDHMLADFRKAE